MQDTSKAPRSRTSGIDRTLQIMDILLDYRRPMTAYELAKSAAAPVSTIYRLIDELVERGMLSRTSESLVWFGPRLMHYGLAYRSRMNMYVEAEKEMLALSRRTGEMVQVCARDGGMMVVIGMAEGEGHFRVTSDVGTRVPLNWTASGLLLLGHLGPAERTAAFAESARPSNTGLAETDPEALSERSRKDFLEGLSVQSGSSEEGVVCIAAPIRDADGACQLTMSVVMPRHRLEEKFDSISVQVREAAKLVERAVGHRTSAIVPA
ncbi:IclR family transcriptional regulator [Martelella mediterranea]|uniref:Kip operon repressor protein n=1 Tax=Martelella mediterranea DSM 17316 TaxID=1122214 RepID=A0A1U9YZY2_9HYPH|nr:IclR family transcriptional regulator [Martelella mediterranea]AQZ51007.1 Kip operon repressor protein [Martelella mediterranea DSM 17316]